MPQEIWSAAWRGAEHVISVDRDGGVIHIAEVSDPMNSGGWTDNAFLRQHPQASDQEIISYVLRRYWPDRPGAIRP